jgi:acyl-CoA thioesterase II
MPAQANHVASSERLLDLLTLERAGTGLFVTPVLHEGPAGLFGGQVAAQALRAAASTVAPERHPHSLHGYFLSRGDASRPVRLTVQADRDGRSYSNRRVIAEQDGSVIFNMAASFHVVEPGLDYQAHAAPEVTQPDELPDSDIRPWLVGVDLRIPEQARPGQQRPSRVWLRARDELGDDTMHACALTYVSDMFTGLSSVPGDRLGPPTSLDHAVWFHRPVALDDWVLMDLQPESIAGGRGMYTGRIFARDGTLAAGIAQEAVWRTAPASR